MILNPRNLQFRKHPSRKHSQILRMQILKIEIIALPNHRATPNLP